MGVKFEMQNLRADRARIRRLDKGRNHRVGLGQIRGASAGGVRIVDFVSSGPDGTHGYCPFGEFSPFDIRLEVELVNVVASLGVPLEGWKAVFLVWSPFFLRASGVRASRSSICGLQPGSRDWNRYENSCFERSEPEHARSP